MHALTIRCWLLVLCLTGINSALLAQCQPIALLDSSFESGVFDIDGRNGWFRSDGGSFEPGAYHGNLSACSNAGSLWQIVRVQPQTTYYLNCYVKNTWSDPYRLFAGGTEYIDSTVASDWTFVSMPFTTGQDTSITLGYFTAGSVCFDFMRLTCDPLSSLDLPAPAINLNIFPNPVLDRITLRFGNSLPLDHATLTNSLGQVLRSQGIGYASQVIWDILDLPVGVYVVRVWRDREVLVRKVVRI